MISAIKANAELALKSMRQVSGIDFGYDRRSVIWLQQYLQGVLASGRYERYGRGERHIIVSVFGAFLGECAARCHGGQWAKSNGTCCLRAGERTMCPFFAVARQLEDGHGLGDVFDATALEVGICRVGLRPGEARMASERSRAAGSTLSFGSTSWMVRARTPDASI